MWLRFWRYQPGEYSLRIVHDPKRRLIAAPPVRDRVVQQALIAEIAPVFEQGFCDESYAWGRGRGPHRAVLAALRGMRRHPFRLTLDVSRYFASIDRTRLLALIARRVRDKATMNLVEKLLAAGSAVYRTPQAKKLLGLPADGRGIPLGGFLSHWSGALYLDGLDHFVKRNLKVRTYQRYMDDLLVFGDDVLQLESVRAEIIKWLVEERGLRLKDPGAGVRSTSEPMTYLGMRISRCGVRPGPKLRRRMTLRLRAAAARGADGVERSVLSYRGLLSSL